MWVEEKSIKQPSNSKNCWCIVWRCVSTRVWWNVWNSPWVTTVFALKCDLAESLYIILEAQVWCGGSSSVLREFQSQMIAGLWMSSRGSETHTGYYTHMWCHVKSDLKGAELFFFTFYSNVLKFVVKDMLCCYGLFNFRRHGWERWCDVSQHLHDDLCNDVVDDCEQRLRVSELLVKPVI